MTSTSRITTDVDKAVAVLLAGGLVGMPTETVYGLAALATNPDAVKKVFDVKGRPYDHPLIVHVSNALEASQWGVFNVAAQRLSDAFWPGPLTLLLPRTSLAADSITGGRNTVAVRVPSHPVTLEFLKKIKSGVVAPSANKFGKVSPTTPGHVLDDLGNAVDIILDGGECHVGIESTIVECVGEDVQILRYGSITKSEIEKVLGRSLIQASGLLRAPGMLEAHYAPHAQVLLFDTLREAEAMHETVLVGHKTCRILHFNDPLVFAQRLYQELRLADRDDISIVCAVLPEKGGLGDAIRDRLAKAAFR